ncbi:uncharacterized protein LOC132195641 isoform X2 [Neocloeon triangulifer]|uniref:uncharacterized protein LOC132195641 isoform X2 n=1 Tax=Neocloeon triangulifer TaxID=2078957 RepID=UPI00286F7A0A|nr:uncharacterized protein LOC132195641 isoform X2 [Neocloeon triangulifer]
MDVFAEAQRADNDDELVFAKMVAEHDGTRELVNAARVLHSKVFNLVPLQELCMRTIVLNLPKFSAVPQLIKCLPQRLKSNILMSVQDMTTRYQATNNYSYPCTCKKVHHLLVPATDNSSLQLKEGETIGSSLDWPKVAIPLILIKQLINPTLLKFDFTLCGGDKFFFDPRGLDLQILKFLAETPEGMTSIVDRRKMYLSPHDRPPPCSGSFVIEYLEKFSNLEHLDMPTISFKDEDVERLIKSCRKLKSVTLVHSSALTSRGLQSVATLPHLEKLSLGTMVSRDSNFLDAFRLIPHLKEITNLEAQSNDFDPNVHLDFRGQTYSLERLNTSVDGCAEQIPTCLPNLKEVIISDPQLNEDTNYRFHEVVPFPHVLSQLPHLSALTLVGTYGEIAEDYLLHSNFSQSGLGPKLTHVTLIDCYGEYTDVFELVLLCPNLLYLKLECDFSQELQTNPDSVDPQLLKLEELHLCCLHRRFNQANLSKLLFAPKLHTLCLKNVWIPEEAIKDSSEPVLQNLVHFDSSFALAKPDVYTLHVTFLKLIVLNCPKLETVKCCVEQQRFKPDEPIIALVDVSPKVRCHFSVKNSLF